jgi:hypothetical protein
MNQLELALADTSEDNHMLSAYLENVDCADFRKDVAELRNKALRPDTLLLRKTLHAAIDALI